MNFRVRTVLQSFILTVLVVFFFMGGFFFENSAPSEENTGYLLPGLKPDSITRILLQRKTSTTELFRDAGLKWRVKSVNRAFPVSAQKVEKFLQDLRDFRSYRDVTRDEASLEKFGVGSTANGSISLFTDKGAEEISLQVGFSSGGGSTVYVRSSRTTAVVETEAAVQRYLDEHESYWMDLRLFPSTVTGETISEVTLNADLVMGGGEVADRLNENYRLVKGNDRNPEAWSFAEKEIGASQREVADLVRSLASLEGTGFLTTARVENPRAELSLSDASGRRYRLLFGEHNGNGYPVQVEGTDYVYEVSGWRAEKILRPLSDLSMPSGVEGESLSRE